MVIALEYAKMQYGHLGINAIKTPVIIGLTDEFSLGAFLDTHPQLLDLASINFSCILDSYSSFIRICFPIYTL